MICVGRASRASSRNEDRSVAGEKQIKPPTTSERSVVSRPPIWDSGRYPMLTYGSGASVPVFLAGFKEGKRPKLIAFTAFRGASRKLLAELKAALPGLTLSIEVREERAIDEASSLEGMLNRLALDRIVYDPLGVFGRAREYVAFAAAVRSWRLGD